MSECKQHVLLDKVYHKDDSFFCTRKPYGDSYSFRGRLKRVETNGGERDYMKNMRAVTERHA